MGLLALGCGRDARPYELDAKNFDSKTLNRIQSDTGITFPAGARGLNYLYKPPIDPAYIAKLEIPTAFRADLIRTLSSIENDDQLQVMESMGKNVHWWVPKGAKLLLDRQRLVRAGNYLRVILTEEGPDLLLYIEWWVI